MAKHNSRPGVLSAWPVIADLMAGILIIMTLLFIIFYHKLNSYMQNKINPHEFILLKKENDKLKKDLNAQKKLIKELEKNVGVKKKIVDALKNKLDSKGIHADVNKIGNIEIKADLIFGHRDTEIPESGKKDAMRIGSAVFEILKDNEYKDNIAMVMVIGHSDSTGLWSHNYNVSTKRATNLVQLWGLNDGIQPSANLGNHCVFAKIVSSGLGETRPKVEELKDCGNQPGDEGCAANRRFEIRIIPKEPGNSELPKCDPQ